MKLQALASYDPLASSRDSAMVSGLRVKQQALNTLVRDQAKFSGNAPAAGGSFWFRAADRFLMLPEWFQENVITPLSRKGGSQTKLSLAKSASVFLSHDYVKRIPMFNLGKVAVRPPVGSIATILYLGALPSRLYAASLRPDIDKGEYLDIIVRDVFGITVFLFWLESTRNLLAKSLAKKGANIFTMSKHGGVYDYKEIDSLYRMTHPNRLLRIITASPHQKAIAEKLNKTINNKAFAYMLELNPTMGQDVNSFKAVFKKMQTLVQHNRLVNQFEEAVKHPELSKLSKEAYELAHKIETGITTTLKKPYARKLGMIPSFKNTFVASGNKGRLLLDVASFLAVTVVLGFGVTWFNEWFTKWRRGFSDNYSGPPQMD